MDTKNLPLINYERYFTTCQDSGGVYETQTRDLFAASEAL